MGRSPPRRAPLQRQFREIHHRVTLRSGRRRFVASSIAGSRSVLGGGVVAVAGAGDEFAAAARGDDPHGDGAERAVAAGVGGVVGQNVLIANVVSDLFADVVHILDVFRKVGQAAGGSGDLLERFAGVLGFFLVFLAEKADGVDHRIGLLDFADHFLKSIAAGIVFAVGDDQQDLLVFGGLLKMIEGADDGVVESGAAA